jgi:hypothetical protein
MNSKAILVVLALLGAVGLTVYSVRAFLAQREVDLQEADRYQAWIASRRRLSPPSAPGSQPSAPADGPAKNTY